MHLYGHEFTICGLERNYNRTLLLLKLSSAVIDASKCVAPGLAAIIRCNLCVKCCAYIFNVLEQFRNALTLLKFVSHINSIKPVCHTL